MSGYTNIYSDAEIQHRILGCICGDLTLAKHVLLKVL